MAEVFGKLDSAWWAQDLPLDADGLINIRDNLIAVWERTAPVLTYSFPTVEAPLDGTPLDAHKIACYHPTCIFARPFFLLPGMKSIKLHFYGTAGPINESVRLHWGHSLGAADLSSPLLTYGEDYIDITAGGTLSPAKVTLDLSIGVRVDRPTFTVLQLWMISNVHTAGTLSALGSTDIVNGGAFITGASGSSTDHLKVLSFYDVDDNLMDRFDIKSSTASGSGAYYTHPRPDIENVNWDQKAEDQITWLVPGSIAIEIVREPGADFLFLPYNYELRPGALPIPTIMDKFQSTAEELTFRARGQVIDVVQQAELPGILEANWPFVSAMTAAQGRIGVSTPVDVTSEIFLPLHMPHEQSQVVRVCLLVSAHGGPTTWLTGSDRDIDVNFEAEIMVCENTTFTSLSANGDWEDAIHVSAEKIPIMSVRVDRMMSTYQPSNQDILGGSKIPLMSRADLDAMRAEGADEAWTLVHLTIRGIPEQLNYSASDQKKPWALRLKMEIAADEYLDVSGHSIRAIALPYIWTEGYYATAPQVDGAAEEIAMLRTDSADDLWLDMFSFKPDSLDLNRNWGVNLNTAGVAFADRGVSTYDRIKVIPGGAEFSQAPPSGLQKTQSTNYFTSTTADPDNMPHMVTIDAQGGFIAGEDESGLLQQLPVDGGVADWANASWSAEDYYERLARVNNNSTSEVVVMGTRTEVGTPPFPVEVGTATTGQIGWTGGTLGSGAGQTGEVGDLHIAVVHVVGSLFLPTALTTPSGWTKFADQNVGRSRMYGYYKVATTTAALTPSWTVGEGGSCVQARFRGQSATIADIFTGDITGNTTNDPPSATETDSTDDRNLFFTAACSGNYNLSLPTAPTGYTLLSSARLWSGTAFGTSIGAAIKEVSGTTDDPGTFPNINTDATYGAMSITVPIPPGAGTSYGAVDVALVDWDSGASGGMFSIEEADIDKVPYDIGGSKTGPYCALSYMDDTTPMLRAFLTNEGAAPRYAEAVTTEAGESVCWLNSYDAWMWVGVGRDVSSTPGDLFDELVRVNRYTGSIEATIDVDADSGFDTGTTKIIDFCVDFYGYLHILVLGEDGAVDKVDVMKYQPTGALISSAYWDFGQRDISLKAHRLEVDIDGHVGVMTSADESPAFPTVGTPTTTSTGSSTSHVVNIPSVVEGDLLLVFSALSVSVNVTEPSIDWESIDENPAGGVVDSGVFALEAAGSEGATVTFTTSSACDGAWHVYKIPAGEWDNSGTIASQIDIGGGSETGGLFPNPPSNTASWGGSENNTFFACYFADASETTSAYPTGYSDGTTTNGTTEATLATAVKQVAADTDDPSAFTKSGSSTYRAVTYILRSTDSTNPIALEVLETYTQVGQNPIQLSQSANDVWLSVYNVRGDAYGKMYDDASQLVPLTTDGDVHSMVDLINGHIFQTTSGNGPQFKEVGTRSGKPVIDFTNGLGLFKDAMVMGNPCTVIFVYEKSADAFGYMLTYSTGGGTRALWENETSGATEDDVGIYDGVHKSFQGNGGLNTDDEWNIWSITFQSDNDAVFRAQNTQVYSNLAFTSLGGTSRMTWGELNTPLVEASELIYFDRELTAAELANLVSFLKLRNGVP